MESSARKLREAATRIAGAKAPPKPREERWLKKHKHFSGEEAVWEDRLFEHQLGGLRAVSVAGFQSNGSSKRKVVSTDTFRSCCTGPVGRASNW